MPVGSYMWNILRLAFVDSSLHLSVVPPPPEAQQHEAEDECV